MADLRSEVIDWFNGSQDYEQGIMLLEKVSTKNKVLSKLMRRGETTSSKEKLQWELNKIARLPRIPAPVKGVAFKLQMPSQSKFAAPQAEVISPEPKLNLLKGKSIDIYPPDVQKLVREYSSLFMERGKLHAELKKVGDGNDAEKVEARRVIIEEISKISARLEKMFEFFDKYEKEGVEINAADLWPEPTEEDQEPTLDIESLSIDELKYQKKNLQSSLTKDRNLMLYGIKTIPPSGKVNPMPEGPKLIKLKKRMARKEQQIYDIEIRLANLS